MVSFNYIYIRFLVLPFTWSACLYSCRE